MKEISCDVLVIGGGPAGLAAARATSMKGLKTVVIEEHEEIGKPVQCGEAIGEYLFRYMPFQIPKEQLKWRIDGMFFWADGITIERKGGIWSGYAINRAEWDKWLAKMASNKGAKILTKTRCYSFSMKENYMVEKIHAISQHKKLDIKAKYIIGADGVNSTTVKCLGVGKESPLVGYVKSYEMKNLKLFNPKMEQIFIGEFAPNAYAYIFPISKDRANVGIGTIYGKENIEEYFEKFTEIDLVRRELYNAKIVTEKSGNAPIENLTDKLVYGNVFLVGDAANQNIKPFIEGNIPAIVCGDLLGKYIYKLYKEGREGSHEEYKKIIQQKLDLIYDSKSYLDFVYKYHRINNKKHHLVLAGLFSGLIPPEEKAVEHYMQNDEKFIEKFLRDKGDAIENL